MRLRPGPFPGGFGIGHIHRAHLRNDLRNFGRRDHGLVRVQNLQTFFADGLLQIGEDLGLVGIVLELGCGIFQVGPQCVVAAFIELVSIAVQVDRNDSLHGHLPN